MNADNSARRRFLKRLGTTTAAVAALGSGTVVASPPDRANARTRGRIDKLGQALPEDAPRYTYGHVREDGMYGAVSSFPRGGNDYGSTLYDLSDLENPVEVHRLETANELTRSNNLKFDGVRDGLYYRTQEADDFGEDDQVGLMGFEVVDYGWGEGTLEDPEIVATVETPNTGVHTLAEHPEKPIVYAVDKDAEERGVIPVDVSDPENPEICGLYGPPGYCHDCEVDTGRNVLHCAYIAGEFEGYAILDLEDPLAPTEIGRFDYEEQPDYEEIGTPGFEDCHQASFDPERGLAVVGDEICATDAIPGGKHVFDIGWDEGSLEDPIPIGFTHSPDARFQEDACFWTTHFHDVVHDGDEVLLVDGGYRQGTWVANITDPTNPTPTERYATDDRMEEAEDHSPGTPPYCWSAVYNEARDFVFASDTLTGAYTFDICAKPARGEDGGGPEGHYDLEAILERGE
ncbi:LVIVD repeat-containing protein [Natronococcus occultus]|nr:twin-arginine translocation signal domain-containing protein [Natronococcus occultus]